MNNILENRRVENGIIIPIEIELNEKDEIKRVTDNYIDISYKSGETASRILSNLFPYKFYLGGNLVFSIEAAIQSFKFQDSNVSHACYEYSGIDAWHLRGMAPYDWQKDGILYSLVHPYNIVRRNSQKYQDLLDELYSSAYQNAKYRFSLEQSNGKQLDHTIGSDDISQTMLTRTEYISRLYALRYCAVNQIIEKSEVLKTLNKVRQELK